MALPIQITVGAGGTNPAPGATVWNYPAYAGRNGWIERTGYGPLKFTDYTVLPGGGVQLLNGLTFGGDGETWFFHAESVVYPVSAGSYSNGFNIDAVLAALENRIGFRPHTETKYAGLVDASNYLSLSGRYFNDFHAIVSAANIKFVQPDETISNANFNTYLSNLKRSVVMRALTAVFSGKEYLEQRIAFDKEDENGADVLLPNAGKFVGFVIDVAEKVDLAVQIDSVGLLLDSDATVPLYLFKDGVKSPVWTGTAEVFANENTRAALENVVLNYIGPVTTGQRFFFGYFQADLGSAKAIRQSVCLEETNYFGLQPFEAPATGPADFNRSQISYTEQPHGLNLEVSAFTDHTRRITGKANLFDELIGLTMAAQIVEAVVYSTRSNGTERVLKAGITEAALIQDLNGSAPVSDGPPPIMGLKARIDREAKRVREALYPKSKALTVNFSCD